MSEFFRKYGIWILLYGLFILEGALFPWILPEWGGTMISPRLVLIVIIYTGLFVSRHRALTGGLVFGILHDLVFYDYMLGLYTFSMGLCGYVSGLLIRRSNPGFGAVMLGMAMVLTLFEAIVTAMYLLFRIANESFLWQLTHSFLPTVLFNLVIALVLYVPVRTILEKTMLPAEDED